MLDQEVIRVRQGLGLTPAQFALLMNVSPATIHYWENGVLVPQRMENIVLLRLWELMHGNPDNFEHVRSEVRHALGLPPAPERHQAAAAAIAGGILGFGLGVFLAALFAPAPQGNPPALPADRSRRPRRREHQQ